MSQHYDDELLKEVDDDIVKPRNAPPRTRSGWGKPSIVVAVLAGVVFGGFLAVVTRSPEPADPHPTMMQTPAVDEESILRMSELEAHVQEHPDDAEARLELAEIYWSIGNWEEAKLQCDEVLVLDPNNSLAWYLLGMYYWGKETPDCVQVEAAWTKYKQLDPSGDHARVDTHLEQCRQMQASPAPTGR